MKFTVPNAYIKKISNQENENVIKILIDKEKIPAAVGKKVLVDRAMCGPPPAGGQPDPRLSLWVSIIGGLRGREPGLTKKQALYCVRVKKYSKVLKAEK